MAWYWGVALGVGIFNLLFVFVAWLVSVLQQRNGTGSSLQWEEGYLSQECILHFLQTMCLAEQQKSNCATGKA